MPHRLYVPVATRARHRCEYCLAPEIVFNLEFEVEHVLPAARGGTDELVNLALACRSCNARKAARLDGIDAQTGQVVALFNPRREDWTEHFELHLPSARITGRTPTGRATIRHLGMNRPQAVRARRVWLVRLVDW